MKVFISWSGAQSRLLGEAFREWLPSVIQMVSPYFTPSDIEKGTRWSEEIAKELSESNIGIICVTRENIHSDWILFEAGALSKSLEKSHVCPILFGISNTDLSGPLKQFQTTEFKKQDFYKLINVINNRLGDKKLPSKTIDAVFEKWWPDLEQRVKEILSKEAEPLQPVRSDRELLEEILGLSRAISKRPRTPSISTTALEDLLENYIQLHHDQANEMSGYQDTLNLQNKMHPALQYIVSRYVGLTPKLDRLFDEFKKLTYQTMSKSTPDPTEDIPF